MKTKISSFVDKDGKRTSGGAERFPVAGERHQSVGGGRKVGRRFFMKSLAMGGALLVPVGASFAEHNYESSHAETVQVHKCGPAALLDHSSHVHTAGGSDGGSSLSDGYGTLPWPERCVF
jgi:hypothetical protein